MAYCVHCGVRLESSESHCPLCMTPVLDPSEPDRQVTAKQYPPRTPDQELKRSRRFLLSLAVILLLLPAAVCLLCDLVSGTGLSWSLYPVSALTLVFVAVTAPSFLSGRYKAVLSALIAFFCLNTYLWIVEILSGSGPWFLPVVFPALLGAALLIALTVMLKVRDILNKLTLLGFSFVDIALECFLVELLCSASAGTGIRFSWSLFVFIPCLFIALGLFFINGNRPLREEIRRRSHI